MVYLSRTPNSSKKSYMVKVLNSLKSLSAIVDKVMYISMFSSQALFGNYDNLNLIINI